MKCHSLCVFCNLSFSLLFFWQLGQIQMQVSACKCLSVKLLALSSFTKSCMHLHSTDIKLELPNAEFT